MNSMEKILISLTATLCLLIQHSHAQYSTITSPDKQLSVKTWLDGNGQARYQVQYQQKTVLEPSALGIGMEHTDFSKGLQLLNKTRKRITDSYDMPAGKRRHCTYTANQLVLQLQNAQQQKMDLI